MAITKIHPIKSTLKKALDYIENPDKTDGKLLVSSFACSYETADIEFEMLLAQAYQKGNNLAHHLIQSFAPGEAMPEQAHEIGRQLVDEVLQGKYPYVLTTHIDKGHVHNHIIFCAVDMVNQRKYISNKQSYGLTLFQMGAFTPKHRNNRLRCRIKGRDLGLVWRLLFLRLFGFLFCLALLLKLGQMAVNVGYQLVGRLSDGFKGGFQFGQLPPGTPTGHIAKGIV